jgi:hypothetical protein
MTHNIVGPHDLAGGQPRTKQLDRIEAKLNRLLRLAGDNQEDE